MPSNVLVTIETSLVAIDILGGRYVDKPPQLLEQLRQHLPLTINEVTTKGKKCTIILEDDWSIIISFGMSGAIHYELIGIDRQTVMKHYHIRFTLSNGQQFYFADPRRFGSIQIFDQRATLDQALGKLGPDILTGVTDTEFIQRLRRYDHKNICVVLMNQEVVSGVGNYIINEALYATRISPFASISGLSDTDLVALNQELTAIAKRAYAAGGASLYTYTGARHEKGAFQDSLKIYRKTHDPEGRLVVVIPDRDSPDKRTKHYVPEVQTIGVRLIKKPIVRLKPNFVKQNVPDGTENKFITGS